MRCRTKSGDLRLYYEGQWITLSDHEDTELPDVLAESIRTHVNVIVAEQAPPPPESASPKPKAKAGKADPA